MNCDKPFLSYPLPPFSSEIRTSCNRIRFTYFRNLFINILKQFKTRKPNRSRVFTCFFSVYPSHSEAYKQIDIPHTFIFAFCSFYCTDWFKIILRKLRFYINTNECSYFHEGAMFICRQDDGSQNKQDGVGPVDNRPLTDQFHPFRKELLRQQRPCEDINFLGSSALFSQRMTE